MSDVQSPPARDLKETRASPVPRALRAPFTLVDGFLPEAEAAAMRAHFDAHFGQPERHQPAARRLWKFVRAGLYTCICGPARKDDAHALIACLPRPGSPAGRRSGSASATSPGLSTACMSTGCAPGIRNDSTKTHGFGFVYSLTRDKRRARGNNHIFKEGNHSAPPADQAKSPDLASTT